MLYIKKFADNLVSYTSLSIFSLVPTLARLSVLHCEDMPGWSKSRGYCSGTSVRFLGTITYSLPWLRAGLPDPCVFWSSRVRHLSVSLLVSVNSRASADLCKLVLTSSLCNWNRESRYTLWQRSACSRLLDCSIGCESSKLCYLSDAEE